MRICHVSRGEIEMNSQKLDKLDKFMFKIIENKEIPLTDKLVSS
jgi:hypothetical protein